MKILVTGATGFIGKPLVEKLLSSGDEVVVLTRSAKKARTLFGDRVDIWEKDGGDRKELSASPSKMSGVEVVVHLSADASYYGKYSFLYQANVKETENLLLLSIKNRVKRFVFASSIEASGPSDAVSIPVVEDADPKPVSAYGRSKLEAEKKVREHSNSIETVILRIGNVYGPGSGAFVVPIVKALKGENDLCQYLSVFADYQSQFIFIDDVVEGLLLAAKAKSGPGVFYLIGKETVTLKSYFEILAKKIGVRFDSGRKLAYIRRVFLYFKKYLRMTLHRADLASYFIAGECGRVHRVYSMERIKNVLGFTPRTGLSEGIDRTLVWVRSKGEI